MFVVAWWNLLLGRSDTCNSALESKLKVTIADATVEYDGCEEATFEFGFFILSLGTGEGVTKFVLVTFLGVEGISRFVGWSS